MSTESYLYWIRLKEHNDILTEGYVGITNNTRKRWNAHLSRARGNQKKDIVHKAIIKYGEENIIFEVICKSTREHIIYLEQMFRPNPKIGWNILQGGCSGRLGLPQTDNQKITVSAALKYRRLSEESLKAAAISNATRTRDLSEIEKRSLAVSSKHLLDLPSTNFDILSRILDIYKCYLLGYKQYKTSTTLLIPYRGMKSMFIRFDKGYNPNSDQIVLVFIKKYVEDFGIYTATSYKNTTKPTGVFKTNNGSFVSYFTKNNKRYSKTFSVNEYGDKAYEEACAYRKALEDIHSN